MPTPIEEQARLVDQRKLDGLGFARPSPASGAGRVPHEHRQREPERQQGESVEDGGNPFCPPVAKELRSELRREGQKRSKQEQNQVEPVERGICCAQRASDRRMLELDAADRKEARDVGEVRRPLLQDRAQEILAGVRRRRCNRKGAVAECFLTSERQLVLLRGLAHGATT